MPLQACVRSRRAGPRVAESREIKNAEKFFAHPAEDTYAFTIRDDEDERVAQKLIELGQTDETFSVTQQERPYGRGLRITVTKTASGQAPPEEVKKRLESEKLRTKDLITLRRIEAFLDPSVSAPAESSDSDLDPCRLDSDDSDYSLRNRDTRAYIE